MAVATPTDRPESACNRCEIECFGGVFVLSLCFLEFSVGVRAFVKKLSQISSFLSFINCRTVPTPFDQEWLMGVQYPILRIAHIANATIICNMGYTRLEYQLYKGVSIVVEVFSLKYILKLYCRYLYTRPCMINHIWGLKQLWLQVNGHAWFHLQRLRWPVRNGEGAKNSKWKLCLQRDSNPHPASPRQESQRLRPLGHEGLMVISGLLSNRIMWYKF